MDSYSLQEQSQKKVPPKNQRSVSSITTVHVLIEKEHVALISPPFPFMRGPMNVAEQMV